MPAVHFLTLNLLVLTSWRQDVKFGVKHSQSFPHVRSFTINHMPTNSYETCNSLKIMPACVAQPTTAPNGQTAVPVLSCPETEPLAKTENPETASLQFTFAYQPSFETR